MSKEFTPLGFLTNEKYEEYLTRMRSFKTEDIEADHQMADGLLCLFLEQIGFTEIVRAYEEIDKWYA